MRVRTPPPLPQYPPPPQHPGDIHTLLKVTSAKIIKHTGPVVLLVRLFQTFSKEKVHPDKISEEIFPSL